MSEVPPLQRPEEQDNLAITPDELSLIQDLIAEGATREEVERQLLERESEFGFEEFTFEEDDSEVVVEEFETTPIIGEEDLVKDHVDEPEDGAAKDERQQESLARSEAEAGKDDDSSEDLIGKLTSGAADIVENLIANTETSIF